MAGAVTLVAQLSHRLGDLQLEASLRADGEATLGLLGPNGAGKSTVLRLLAGLLALDRGRVELDDRVLEDTIAGLRLPPERRGVGLLFQTGRLFQHLSALDNVAYGLRCAGSGRRSARARAAALLEELGMAAVSRRRPRELSGGQAQVVALARTLATRPRLLLLDEPLAAVDASARVELRRVITHRLAEHAGPRLVVTHDPVEAATLTDRVVVLESGRVVQEGGFAELTARPRSAWVARMAGLNLLRGRAGPGTLELPGGISLTVVGAVLGPALATIHPRAVALHREAPSGSPRNVLSARVAGVDHEGDRWRARLEGPVPLVAEVTPAAGTELRLAEGGEVFAAVKATEIDVYAE